MYIVGHPFPTDEQKRRASRGRTPGRLRCPAALHVARIGTTGYASKQYVRETTPSEPDQEPTGDYVIVDVSSTLRLRQQPNTSSATLAYMPDGATLELLSYGDEWCYVEYNGVKGYASTDYLTIVKGAVG